MLAKVSYSPNSYNIDEWMDYETGEIERKDKNYELSKWMERGGTNHLLKVSLPIHSVQTTSALIHSLDTNSKRDAASVTISNGVNNRSSDSDSDLTTDSNDSFYELPGLFIASNKCSDRHSDLTTDSNTSNVFGFDNPTTNSNTSSYTDKGDDCCDCNCSDCNWGALCWAIFVVFVGCCLGFICFSLHFIHV